MHLAEWGVLGLGFVISAWWWWRINHFMETVESRLKDIDRSLEKLSKD